MANAKKLQEPHLDYLDALNSSDTRNRSLDLVRAALLVVHDDEDMQRIQTESQRPLLRSPELRALGQGLLDVLFELLEVHFEPLR